MEASFRDRIDRTFGSLSDGQTRFWNVKEIAASTKNTGLSRGAGEGETDDEEASGLADFLNAQRRGGRGERLGARFFGEEDLEDLDDDGGDDEDVEDNVRVGKKTKKEGGGEQTGIELATRVGDAEPPKLEEDDVDDDDEEVREVREMVGMDDTLDFEEEEDEYDKVAVGREGTDDRLFMSQVRNFGANRQQLNPLPTSFIEMRDSRANHKAALARLEEDDREAATRATEELTQAKDEFKTQEVEYNGLEEPKIFEDLPARHDNGGEAMDIDGEGKRRKSGKRVRFSIDEAAGGDTNRGRPDEIATPDDPASTDPVSIVSITYPVDPPSAIAAPTRNRYSRVPDHVKHPSRYIHYTLDWSEEDEEKANMAAFHAARAVSSSTLDMVTDKQEELALVESQGRTIISFNPLVSSSKRTTSNESGRRGSKEARRMGPNGDLSNRVVNVAANFDTDGNLGGVITMEDDQELIGQEKSGRAVRRYRNRVTDCDIETE